MDTLITQCYISSIQSAQVTYGNTKVINALMEVLLLVCTVATPTRVMQPKARWNSPTSRSLPPTS
jgi:hypothetical protein